MKRIEITTTQNVKIEYNAATLWERILAWIIDFFTLVLFLSFSSLFISLIFPAELTNIISLVFITPVFLLYHPLFEIMSNGRSLGKLAMGIKVVKITSDTIRLSDYFMRWVFRLVDIGLSVGIVAIVTILSSPMGQRIGDFLSDTAVIKIKKSDRLSLHRILELDSLKNYEPKYPGVVAFTEDDMLTIKEAIDRSIQFPSDGSDKALFLTIERVEEILNIKVKKKDIDFLRTIIKDYVALTR